MTFLGNEEHKVSIDGDTPAKFVGMLALVPQDLQPGPDERLTPVWVTREVELDRREGVGTGVVGPLGPSGE